MATSQKMTKQVVISPELRAGAAKHTELALAWIIDNANGMTYSTALSTLGAMVADKDAKAMLFCMAAVVTIRNGFTFMETPAGISKYPPLVMAGRPGIMDSTNYRNAHIIGQMIFEFAGTNQLALAALEKNGSCLFRSSWSDRKAVSEGEIINKSIADGWPEGIASAMESFGEANPNVGSACEKLCHRIPAMSKEFGRFIVDSKAELKNTFPDAFKTS